MRVRVDERERERMGEKDKERERKKEKENKERSAERAMTGVMTAFSAARKQGDEVQSKGSAHSCHRPDDCISAPLKTSKRGKDAQILISTRSHKNRHVSTLYALATLFLIMTVKLVELN